MPTPDQIARNHKMPFDVNELSKRQPETQAAIELGQIIYTNTINNLNARIAELEAQLAAAQATIEQMRAAIGSWDRADTPLELQAAEAKLIACMVATNLDTLHEVRALECERLRDEFTNAEAIDILTAEAAAHRAKKGEGE